MENTLSINGIKDERIFSTTLLSIELFFGLKNSKTTEVSLELVPSFESLVSVLILLSTKRDVIKIQFKTQKTYQKTHRSESEC